MGNACRDMQTALAHRRKLIALACAIVHITSRQNANHFWCVRRKNIVCKKCRHLGRHIRGQGRQVASRSTSPHQLTQLIYCNFVGIFPINLCSRRVTCRSMAIPFRPCIECRMWFVLFLSFSSWCIIYATYVHFEGVSMSPTFFPNERWRNAWPPVPCHFFLLASNARQQKLSYIIRAQSTALNPR